jgi:hypothetical protein
MSNNKNLILAFALSALVLFVWQYFVAGPQMQAEQAKQTALTQTEASRKPAQAPPSAPTAPGDANLANGALPGSGMTGAPGVQMSREAALKAGGARVVVDSPMVDGSILLKGARDIPQQSRKWTGWRGAPGHQHIIVTFTSKFWQKPRGSSPQAAPGPIADHRIADLAAGGEAHTQTAPHTVSLGGGADLKRNGAFDAADSPRGSQEIGTDFEAIHCDAFP